MKKDGQTLVHTDPPEVPLVPLPPEGLSSLALIVCPKLRSHSLTNLQHICLGPSVSPSGKWEELL